MKKLLSLIVVSLLALSLCACGGGTQCEHQASEDSLLYGYYVRTTATCSQGGIEYHDCYKCGKQEIVEVEVGPYEHVYESLTEDQSNFKCNWCEETQITLNATFPITVSTNYSYGTKPLASKMTIKNVKMIADNEFDPYFVLTFDVEATQIAEPLNSHKYMIRYKLKDQDGNVVWENKAKGRNHEYGERDLKVGDQFEAISTCYTRYFYENNNNLKYENNVKYTFTIEFTDPVIIDYSTGNHVDNIF